MTTNDLLNYINKSIGPATPFDSSDGDELLQTDRMRKEWFQAADQESLCDALVDIFLTQPPVLWPDRHDLFEDEVCAIVALFKDTVYSNKILQALKTVLPHKEKRRLAIKAVGALGLEEGVVCLRLLPMDNLSEEEMMDLACSLGMIGGDQAKMELKKMQANPSSSSPDVQDEINIALSRIGHQ